MLKMLKKITFHYFHSFNIFFGNKVHIQECKNTTYKRFAICSLKHIEICYYSYTIAQLVTQNHNVTLILDSFSCIVHDCKCLCTNNQSNIRFRAKAHVGYFLPVEMYPALNKCYL